MASAPPGRRRIRALGDGAAHAVMRRTRGSHTQSEWTFIRESACERAEWGCAVGSARFLRRGVTVSLSGGGRSVSGGTRPSRSGTQTRHGSTASTHTGATRQQAAAAEPLCRPGPGAEGTEAVQGTKRLFFRWTKLSKFLRYKILF